MQYITYEDYLKYISTVVIKEEGEKYQFEKNSKEEKYNKEKIEKIDKVHDKTLKIVLNIKREVIKLLKGFLDIQEEIKEEEIEEYPTEFITKNYKEKRSDIIYKIKEKPVYFLIEHQSTEDKEMIERIGIYVQEIMRKTKERGKYPIVVPIVIYTGYKRWKAKTIFSDKQYKEKRYEEYELNLKYNLISMQDYTYEELLKKGTLFSSVLIIEKCRTEEELEERLEEIIEKTKDEKDKEILEQIIKNVLQPQFGKEKTEKILEKMKERRKEGMSPLTKMFFDLEYKAKEEGMNEGLRKGMNEGLRKGRNEGLRKGRNEGIKKGILNMAKKMIERKMEMKEIEEITGLTKKELQNLVKN